jgi:hypothetical protein
MKAHIHRLRPVPVDQLQKRERVTVMGGRTERLSYFLGGLSLRLRQRRGAPVFDAALAPASPFAFGRSTHFSTFGYSEWRAATI